MVSRRLKAIVFTLAFFAATCLLFKASSTSAQKPAHETRSTMRWEQNDDGSRISVEIQGKAEFTDDFSDISDVSEKGYVRIEEEHSGQSRRYEVRKNSDGRLDRTYAINGVAHAVDQEARTWIARFVLDAV